MFNQAWLSRTGTVVGNFWPKDNAYMFKYAPSHPIKKSFSNGDLRIKTKRKNAIWAYEYFLNILEGKSQSSDETPWQRQKSLQTLIDEPTR